MATVERGHVFVDEMTTADYGDGEVFAPWPVFWAAIWVGALAAIAVALIFGLTGIALGMHHIRQPINDWKDVGFWTLAFSVLGAFISFAAGGWIAVKISGLRRSEPAMLHGAILWLVAVPMLLVLASLGAAAFFGTWYSGLAGTPAWILASTASNDSATAAAAARNGALGAVASLLLGLTGAVIGGWMASGEPMTFTYYRRRQGMPTVRHGG